MWLWSLSSIYLFYICIVNDMHMSNSQYRCICTCISVSHPSCYAGGRLYQDILLQISWTIINIYIYRSSLCKAHDHRLSLCTCSLFWNLEGSCMATCTLPANVFVFAFQSKAASAQRVELGTHLRMLQPPFLTA